MAAFAYTSGIELEPITDDDRDEWTVHVYRDHPAWDQHARWFMLPAHLLRELYITTYVYRSYSAPHENSEAIRAIRRDHPDCMLVY